MTSLLKNIQAGMVSLKTSNVPATLENQVSNTESLGRQEVCAAVATAAMNANVWGQEKTLLLHSFTSEMQNFEDHV
jgi:hypothetical protein